MGRLAGLFAIFAGLSAVVAAPVEPRGLGSSSFSLEVAKKESYKLDYLKDWAAAHSKWVGGVPEGASKLFSLAPGESQVDVQPMSRDEVYVAEIEIGTPPQKLKVALDTGSSDVYVSGMPSKNCLWVQSMDTRYRINQHGPWPPRYNPNVSTSARKIDNAMWNIRYVAADDSNAVGIVYRDVLRLGDFEVKNALIESAALVSDTFEMETGFSGIMGLAKQLKNNIQPPQPNFLSVLGRQLKAPVFTVDLRKNATSHFGFGHVNESLGSDKLSWLQSNPKNPHWAVEFDLTAWTGNHSVWMYHKFEAIIDTGTSLMFMPDPLASMYWRQVPEVETSLATYGSYRFPCRIGDELPDLLLKLPGTEHVLTIPGRYLNYGPTEEDPSICWGGMQSSGQLGGTAILGDVMLKALFVAFDLDKGRVGFANKVLHDVK
ncbi:Aspartic protease pep1 [Tolypocladium capitatum]|uniref:Aspartic protease pep1 n=1 Tax=Tolypocladium capitatum TaxID=45235 RepID=A0A2K3Q9J0_9HYPO|nr:Aspartic protease pep1 [Tolypocladium capitatum]